MGDYRAALVLLEIRELHTQEQDYRGRTICGYCTSLCHSETGLGCEYDGDGLWPCDTVKILEKLRP